MRRGHTRKTRAAILVLTGLLLLPSHMAAQNGGVTNPLLTVTSLRCSFAVTASAAWKEGQPDAKVTPQAMQMTISNIDVQDGTADVRGPDGRHLVTATLSEGSLYLFQIERGSLSVATVFATEASPNKLKAVYTRQSFVYLTVPPVMDAPTVSQSYGACEIVR